MPLSLNIKTFGKKDQFRLAPEELVNCFSSFTGRKERNPQDIQEMVESLLANDQINPITYRKEDGKVVVVTGHTRILAGVEINKRRLVGFRFNDKNEKVEVQYGLESPDVPFLLKADFMSLNSIDGMFSTFVENDGDGRKSLTAVDIAYFIETVSLATKMTDTQIAEKLGKPQSWASQHRTVAELDPATKAEISGGNMSLSVAGTVAAIKSVADRAAVISHVKHENNGVISGPAVTLAIEQLGVETSKPIGRSAKVVKGWMNKAINSVPDGDPRQKFLLVFSDFTKGILPESDLDTAFEALMPVESETEMSATV